MNSTFGVIVFILVVVIVSMVVGLMIRNAIFKQLDELEEWKNSITNRQTTEQLSRLKELNLTGQTEELFEKWRDEWDDIVGVTLPSIEKSFDLVEQQASKYNYHGAKKTLRETKTALREVDDKINEIVRELDELVGSKEKNTVEMEDTKAVYRKCKKDLLAHRHVFTISEKKLEETLDNLQTQLKEFDEVTEEGNYLLARQLCVSITNEVNALHDTMKLIPDLQAECQATIPVQIESIEDGYKQMKEDGYILTHLQLDEELEYLKQCNETCITYIKELQAIEAEQLLKEIKEKVDYIYDQLELEVAAKKVVEAEIWTVHDDIIAFKEKANITKEETQFVKLSYQLSERELEVQKYVEKQLAILRKRFDMVQVRIGAQDVSFSVIQEDLTEIREQLETLKDLHTEYMDTLYTLRKDELATREKLVEMKNMMMEARRLLQYSNLPGLPKENFTQLEEAGQSIVKVYEQLEIKPLNMNAIDDLLQESFAIVTSSYNGTRALVEDAYLSEKVIQYGNRYRSASKEAAFKLEQAEKLFRTYQYEAALEQGASLVESIEPGVVAKLRGTIDID